MACMGVARECNECTCIPPKIGLNLIDLHDVSTMLSMSQNIYSPVE